MPQGAEGPDPVMFGVPAHAAPEDQGTVGQGAAPAQQPRSQAPEQQQEAPDKPNPEAAVPPAAEAKWGKARRSSSAARASSSHPRSLRQVVPMTSDEELAMQLHFEDAQMARGNSASSQLDADSQLALRLQQEEVLRSREQQLRSSASSHANLGERHSSHQLSTRPSQSHISSIERLALETHDTVLEGRMWDPVWGEVNLVEFREEQSNWQWQRRVCCVALFGALPCLLVTVGCVCCPADFKSGASSRDVRAGWRRCCFSWSMVFAIPQLVFFVLLLMSTDEDNTFFDAHGAKNTAKILVRNEWWRVLTPLFLHAGWLHLLGNVFLQLRTALALEITWGHAEWLGIYLFSGIVGSLWSCIFFPDNLMVGSSGALCGVIGAWPVFIAITWNQTLPNDRMKRNVLLAFLVISIVVLIGFSFFPLVDWAAHFGGLLAGAAAACALFARRLQADWWCIFTGIGGGIIALVLLVWSMGVVLMFVSASDTLLQL